MEASRLLLPSASLSPSESAMKEASRSLFLWLFAVSPASVKIDAVIISAPDDHFIAGPHCRVKVSVDRRVGDTGGCPTVGARIVSPASIKNADVTKSAPNDHFAAGPNCRVPRSS